MAQHPFVMRGMPAFLYGGDYNPEQWIKEKDRVWKKDMELARQAGINTLSVGIFSWSMLEPREGEYHFEWLDEVMDMLSENGIRAVLATPSGARPPWMAEKYPEVLRVDEYRRRQLFGKNGCIPSGGAKYSQAAAAVCRSFRIVAGSASPVTESPVHC